MRDQVAVVLPPREGFAPQAVGAIGLLAHRLARHTQAHRTRVLGAAAADAPFADVPFQPLVPPRWYPGPASAAYAHAAAAALRRMDALALIEVHNRPDVALALARRLPTIPVLLVLHNDPQDMRQARSAAARQRLCARLAGIATVSAWLRTRLLQGVDGPANPVSVLPNSLDIAALPPALPQDARPPQILFAGRLVADKGADRFVAACAAALPRLPGWQAEMIGADRFAANAPPTPFIRALVPAARDAGITLLGHLPHAQVLDAMARAALVVVPSVWPEPFGLTALEAMASGAALLSSARGGLAELVGDAAWRIDPDHVPELADAIVALAQDAPRRAALGQAGMARARAEFDVRPAAARLDALRCAIIARHAGFGRAT